MSTGTSAQKLEPVSTSPRVSCALASISSCVLLLLPAARAQAEDTDDTEPEVMQESALAGAPAVSGWDTRGLAEGWMIAPADTVRVGIENTMVTADGDLTPILGTPQLALTDVALLDLSLGYSVGGKVELFAHSTLLPKQPIQTDAMVWQGAGFGARIGLAPHYAATLGFAGGPTLNGEGAWGGASLSLDARYEADRYIVFDGRLGAGGTGLYASDAQVGLTEALAAADVILRAPRHAAISVGFEFAFPFWSRDEDPVLLDPQTRVNLHTTGVLSLADQWDVWLRLAYIDRGDISAPQSILPILVGGFDQQHLTLGITYRSEDREPSFAM